MTKELVPAIWNYSAQAKYYEYRPNYAPAAIDALSGYAHARQNAEWTVADIGAGTGNLSIMLLERKLHVTAVEPNDNMRNIGIERTKDNKNIQWVKASGTETTLADQSADWVTFGSSFNVMDRNLALAEAHRLLKPSGYFSCMWNHRDLEDPIQKTTEDILVRFFPDYDRGVRRQDQRPVIEASPLFKDIFYLEVDFSFERHIDDFIKAWRSVKNKYWDLGTEEGSQLFDRLAQTFRDELPETFPMRYTTRGWSAQRVDP